MKTRRIFHIFLVVFAFFIILNMGIHMVRTNRFNQQSHAIEEGDNQDCTFVFAPQNGNDISWTRSANVDGEPVELYACSFEGIFGNKSEIEVTNWTARFDFMSDCYLNSAWCGILEIHQFEGAEEKVQTLDLRKIEKETVTLNFYEDGDIYLFPTHKGDYIIYYPDAGAREIPVVATAMEEGKASIGIIIYWNQEKSFTAPTYSVTYEMKKGYFQGREAFICLVTSILWVMILIAGISVHITQSVMQKRVERELTKNEIERKTAEKMLDELIKALAFSIDAKDGYTHGHSERVAEYSLKLAQKLNLTSEECKEIFYAGLVHDVGKIAVPESIINKPGKLTDEEFEVIKRHPGRGEKILKQIEDMPYLALGAKYHHERYDGKGYPSHAAGEEIPKLARIIAVADAYDAMTSQRSYRKTLDQRIVKQEIWKGIGTQFDPVVAKQMIALIDADVNYDMREKVDETYNLINEIQTNEFWKDYDPKSIKSETVVMSDTTIKYFTEFICSVEHWMNPVREVEITEQGVEIVFHSKTKEDASFIWNVPIAIFYSSEDGKPLGGNFKEIAVFMGAGYSWKTEHAKWEESHLIRKEAFGDWNNWLACNKAGLEYRFRARREINSIIVTLDNDLLCVEGRIDLLEGFDKKVYLCISGENCMDGSVSR